MNASGNLLYERLKAHSHTFHKVVQFDARKDKLFHFDLTEENEELKNIDLADTTKFSEYIEKSLKKSQGKVWNWGI